MRPDRPDAFPTRVPEWGSPPAWKGPRAAWAVYLAASRRAGGTLGPGGFEYLHRLVLRLARGRADGPAREVPGRSRHVRPADLCRTFEKAAAEDFGRLAPVVLDRWGLRSGADIGRAVLLLAEEKCLTLDEGESLDEYRAVGDFRFLPA